MSEETKSIIKVVVRCNFPDKRVVVDIKKDGSVAEAKEAANKALGLERSDYGFASANFGDDVTEWGIRKDNDRHDLVQLATLVVSAPPTLLPKARRKKPKKKEVEEASSDSSDDEFKGFTLDNVWKKLDSKGKEGKVALDYFDANTTELLDHKSWISLSKANLVKILQRDSLSPDTELQLFLAVIRWAEADLRKSSTEVNGPNLQKALDGVLEHVRFPLMSTEDVASKVVATGVLSQSQTLALFTYLAQTRAGIKATITGWNIKPREGVGNNCWNTSDCPDTRLEIFGQDFCSVQSPTSAINANIGCRAKFGYSSGKHYWEIRVEKYDGGGNGYNVAGVCLKEAPLADPSHGYPLSAATDRAWVIAFYRLEISRGSSHNLVNYGEHKQVATGDIVGFLLDCGAGTLTIFHNGTRIGTPFTDLKGRGKLYPVIGLGRLNRNIYVANFKAKMPKI